MEMKSMLVADDSEGDAREGLSDVCVVNLAADLRLLEANDDFLFKLGRPGPEVYGQPFGDFVHPSMKQVIQQNLTRLAEGNKHRFSSRYVAPRSAPNRFTGGLTGIAVRGDDGRVATIVLLIRPDRVPEPQHAASNSRKPLSELDAKVLEGVAAGSSTVQLAAKLYLSRQGVEYHVGAMLRRFKCSNRSALVAKAYTQGILRMGQWPPKVTPDFVR